SLFTKGISESITKNKQKIEKNVKQLKSKTKKFMRSCESQSITIENKLLLKDDNYTYYDSMYKIDYKEFPNISKKAIDNILLKDNINNDFIIINTELVIYDLIKKSFSGRNNFIYIVPIDERIFNKKANINALISMLPNNAINKRVYFKISYSDFIDGYNKIKNFTDKINIVISDLKKINSESEKLLDRVKLIMHDNSEMANFDEIKQFAQESKIPMMVKKENNYEWVLINEG
ncbi:MAG: hypothetical protein PHO63_05890, partial [Bacilli bacterium]|nr:hypothetical protein [Bacilli bacterium]